MKHLPLLIRLARQSLDERGSELADIRRTRAEAEAALAAHDARLAAEARAAADDPDATAVFAAWARQVRRQGHALRARVTDLDHAEQAALAALRAAFAETRSLELVRDAAARTRQRDGQRRDDQLADELDRMRHEAARD